MTVSDRRTTERVSTEAEALDLGWWMSQTQERPRETTFSRGSGCRIVVGWSDNGVATSAQRIRSDGGVLASKTWDPDGTDVGRWVRLELKVGSRDTTLCDAGPRRRNADLTELGDALAAAEAVLREGLERLGSVRTIADSLGPVLRDMGR